MNTGYIKFKSKEFWFHILIWVFILGTMNANWQKIFLFNGVLFVIITIIVPIYINALFLIPRYFKKSSWAQYLILLIFMLVIVNVIKAIIFSFTLAYTPEANFDFKTEFNKWVFRDFRNFDKFVFSGTTWVVYLSFAYRIGKDWIINESVQERLISEKVSMELALLKSQINPHFLFNTLNNIYAISLAENATSTAENISKLGTLMRYSLHDAQADFILLSKELEYIEQYLEMQELRITEEERLIIDISIHESEISNEMIAPMILMPFIENAFKYGVSTTNESQIRINVKLSNSILSLDIQNTVHNKDNSNEGGIGLANVENRLNLIYPNGYKLNYGLKNGKYNVKLELNLSK